MARPKGSKDKGQRTRYEDATKAVMAAIVDAVGATTATRFLKKQLGKRTPSIATLCNIAGKHGIDSLHQGAEIDLDVKDVLACFIEEVGLTGVQESLKTIKDGSGKCAVTVPSLPTLGKIAKDYGIKLNRGRRAVA